MKIEILVTPGCQRGQRTAALVAEVAQALAAQAEVETIVVSTPEEADRLGFLGSPTVRVDGVDLEPEPPTHVGQC